MPDRPLRKTAIVNEDSRSSSYRQKAFVKALRLRLRASLRQQGEGFSFRYPALSKSVVLRPADLHGLGYPNSAPRGWSIGGLTFLSTTGVLQSRALMQTSFFVLMGRTYLFCEKGRRMVSS